MTDLVDRGILHPTTREIFLVRTADDAFGREIAFHRHQTDAFEVANRRESYVLTTGTGSGKSMSYIVPIVDRVLREGSGQGVRAIVVYPMNALANSQRNELEKFLGKNQPKVTFARYTGQESHSEREVILANPPDILLTNYVMLELMLTRPRERSALITSAGNLSFLVLLKIQQQDDEGGFLDDRMIAALMRLLLIAGHETTAATLAWTAERLVRHPEVMTKLYQTLAAGDETYLDAVIAEAMRVRPPVPVTLRAVERDCVINDLAVPAGTIVMLYINAIHKRADLYPDPLRFDPERFAGHRPDTRHWMPFGGGAHYCVGAQLSLLESRALLRTILEQHRFAADRSPDERQVQHRSLMTLPGNGARVTLLRRELTDTITDPAINTT